MVSIILGIALVNLIQRMYMKLIGADVIFFSGKKKIGFYILASFLLYSVLGV